MRARSISTLALIVARIGEKERQRGKPDEIAGAAFRLEIGVEHGVGVRAQPALAEIHQQKGEIVEHIDGGEPVVELDRVEQDGRAVDLDDVAQMQIAVAVAHIASPAPAPRAAAQA